MLKYPFILQSWSGWIFTKSINRWHLLSCVTIYYSFGSCLAIGIYTFRPNDVKVPLGINRVLQVSGHVGAALSLPFYFGILSNYYPLYIQRRIYMNCVSSVGLCNNNRSTICYIFMEIYSINSRLLPCTMFICEEYLLRCWGLGIHLMWIYCIVIRHPSSNLCLWELKRGIILYQLLHVKQHYHVWHPTGMNNYQIENYLLAIICQFLC